MWEEVTSYGITWDCSAKTAIIELMFKDGSRQKMDGLNTEELGALTDILRNEKPIYFNPHDRKLSTSFEHVGEAED